MAYVNEILAESERGDFYGASFSQDECELYQDAFVARRLLVAEPDLESLKWFDYREEHTVVNTFRFAADYRRMYKDKTREYIGEHIADQVQGFSGEDVFQNSRALTVIWTARQEADKLTMPYPTYIRFAFDALYERKWKRLPSPNQLYAPATVNVISERWVKQVMTEAPMPKSDRYSVDNQDLQMEIDGDVADFQRWLVEIIKGSRNLTSSLCHYLFYAKLIRPEIVVENFGEDALQSAIKFYSRTK